MRDLENSVVFITGGTSGYGKAMAKAFRAKGARVIIAARHMDSINAALQPEDIADTAVYIASLPDHAVVEEVTVWGVDQVVSPL